MPEETQKKASPSETKTGPKFTGSKSRSSTAFRCDLPPAADSDLADVRVIIVEIEIGLVQGTCYIIGSRAAVIRLPWAGVIKLPRIS